MAFNNVKEVKWTSRSNQIHEYKVDLKVMHNAKMTGGKDLLYLKVNTTLKKPTRVSEDLIISPRTIYFHVNDFKLSHQYNKLNDDFINTLRDE